MENTTGQNPNAYRKSHVARRKAEDAAAARRIERVLAEMTPEEIAAEEAKAAAFADRMEREATR